MIITLGNYRPLDYAKSTLDFASEAWNARAENWQAICKKVGSIALAILAFLPALAIDLVFSAASLLYRASLNYFAKPAVEPIQLPDRPLNPGVLVPPIGTAPDGALIDNILMNPYPIRPPKDDAKFFKDALLNALKLLGPQKRGIYKELIENYGVLVDGDPPIEIFQWSAGTLLVHAFLSNTYSYALNRYPYNHPKQIIILANPPREQQKAIDLHIEDVRKLYDVYRNFSRLEKASFALQIIDPETKRNLEANVKALVDQVNARAVEMTRDPFFKTIYTPARADVENF